MALADEVQDFRDVYVIAVVSGGKGSQLEMSGLALRERIGGWKIGFTSRHVHIVFLF